MKKQHKRVVVLLICAMMLTLAACGRKTYTSLEEWYADNPSEKMEKQSFSEESNTASVGISIEGNTIVYKMNLGTKITGRDELTDSIMLLTFDSALAGDKSGNDQLIKQISDKSGIDASLISIRYELYNPGEKKPCYNKTYPE